jgi:hypothetical protein
MTEEIGLAEDIEAARDIVEGAFAAVSWLRSGNHIQALLTNIRQSRA